MKSFMSYLSTACSVSVPVKTTEAQEKEQFLAIVIRSSEKNLILLLGECMHCWLATWLYPLLCHGVVGRVKNYAR